MQAVTETFSRAAPQYGFGTKQSTGTAILSVSGDRERPGIYEYPFGVRVGQVLSTTAARVSPRRW